MNSIRLRSGLGTALPLLNLLHYHPFIPIHQRITQLSIVYRICISFLALCIFAILIAFPSAYTLYSYLIRTCTLFPALAFFVTVVTRPLCYPCPIVVLYLSYIVLASLSCANSFLGSGLHLFGPFNLTT